MELTTLFKGELAPVTMHVAPLLIQIPEETDFYEHWSGRMGNSSGILLLSPDPQEKLLKHLQEIFRVTDENGEKYLFRYYDPRVIRPFMKTFDPQQLEAFFGNISWIFVEDETPGSLLTFARDSDGSLLAESVPMIPFDPKSRYAPPPQPEEDEKKGVMSRFKKS